MVVNFPFRRAWFSMLKKYSLNYPSFPNDPALVVRDLSDLKLFNWIEEERPDLVLVSGTSLLEETLIDKIKEYGHVMNLHTGISPYIKGGPNCTNWCLSMNRYDLIGNTIMWINPGIDSGDIITTERTPITGDESLLELHLKVMDHAHVLYLRAVDSFVKHKEIKAISQSHLPSHRLFLTKDWGLASKVKALFNLSFCYNSKRVNQQLMEATEAMIQLPSQN